MTHTTCTHPTAEAAETVACGEPQRWYCETIDGCGDEFTIIKPHHVSKFSTHSPECVRRYLPASWCGCEVVRTAGCVDCDREFPLAVETNTEGADPVIVFN